MSAWSGRSVQALQVLQRKRDRERKTDNWLWLLRGIQWPSKEYQFRLRLVLSVVHENQEANAVEVLKPGRMTALATVTR